MVILIGAVRHRAKHRGKFLADAQILCSTLLYLAFEVAVNILDDELALVWLAREAVITPRMTGGTGRGLIGSGQMLSIAGSM
jgi:hypothetical protein